MLFCKYTIYCLSFQEDDKRQYNYQMQKITDERKRNNMPPPTISEFAKLLDIDEQEVIFTLESARMPVSLQHLYR